MAPFRLFLLFAALILYASFYPFEFSMERLRLVWDGPLSGWLPLRRSGPGDMIANALAYIPIGLFLRQALPDRTRSFFLATGIGFLMSLFVELAQNATRTRNPNLMDLVLNTVSTAVGAGFSSWMASALAPVFARARKEQRRIPIVAVLLILVWIAIHCAPFVPTIGMSKLRNALSPLRHGVWTLDGSARWFAAWIIFMYATRELVANRKYLPHVLLVAIGGSLFTRILFVNQSMSWNELVGLIPATLVVLLLPAWSCVFVGLGLLIYGLAPFSFSNTPSRFNWIPFAGLLEGDWGHAYLVALEKGFLYAGAVWLTYRAGFNRIASGVGIALLLAVIEVAQMYLPGRLPEITDPLIALLAILLLETRKGGGAPR